MLSTCGHISVQPVPTLVLDSESGERKNGPGFIESLAGTACDCNVKQILPHLASQGCSGLGGTQKGNVKGGKGVMNSGAIPASERWNRALAAGSAWSWELHGLPHGPLTVAL